jgi:hypothetical protein
VKQSIIGEDFTKGRFNMAGLMGKLIKGAAKSEWWKKIRPKAVLSEEAEQGAQEMAEELAARRGTAEGTNAASGGLAAHPSQDISDAELDELMGKAAPEAPRAPLSQEEVANIRKKYNITPDEMKRMDKEEYDRRVRKEQKLVGTTLRGKPTIQDVEAIVNEEDKKLVETGRELFPDMAEESDQVILGMMKLPKKK